VAFPHFSRLQEHPHELANQVGVYFRRLLTICYAWAVLGWLLASPMTHLVYTDKWMPGVASLQLFALGLVFDVANWVGGMTLTAVGGVKETAKWTLIKSVLAISGAFIGVHALGLVGIPLASIFASTISGAGLVIQLRKRVPMDMSDLWKPGVPYILAAAAYAPFFLAGGITQSIASWCIGTVVIAGTVWKAVREFRATKILVATT